MISCVISTNTPLFITPSLSSTWLEISRAASHLILEGCVVLVASAFFFAELTFVRTSPMAVVVLGRVCAGCVLSLLCWTRVIRWTFIF